jgi:hypothetical protein
MPSETASASGRRVSEEVERGNPLERVFKERQERREKLSARVEK